MPTEGTSYEPVIGLEIHAQLLTETKIFCGCSTRFGAPPNTHVCPVCLGLPGALPVLNRRAVEYAVRAALALGCTIQETSIFARKNYFYPDLPKGYQISQYERPLATGGALEYVLRGVPHRVGIVRVHLEEDAGKSLHEGFPDSDRHTYVDFNRSGVPLIEIVTQPDLTSGADAAEFFSRLRAILMAIGVNDGNMEEGSLRCDANVSVRPRGTATLGVKTEVKNVNSFRYLQRALEFEIERQIAVLSGGGRMAQETRLWDSGEGRTVSMRTKEEAHDYRYFPEPDLPPLVVDEGAVAAARAALPELPDARKARFMAAYALSEADAAFLSQTEPLGRFFEATAAAAGNPRGAANWIVVDLQSKLKELDADITRSPIGPTSLGGLIRMIDSGAISGPTAKDVFEKMCASGREAEEIVRAEGLARIDDAAAIESAIERVLAENPAAASDFRSGKTKTFGFLVGQVMKATGGKANPALVNALLKKALE
ncbi:MAG TPA: Asp-tRNA(Asn)/Glu-tRNA(Gln) amidotransferase subunit GatB [Vicinamibacterales bacterium]|nr:Asp-tRNA(Asn)/Glu-tRNA(Gln) amidotransferase subunit GatB [Vicinamibacterales bacterium]